MDGAKLFTQIVGIARTAKYPSHGWQQMCNVAERALQKKVHRHILSLPIDAQAIVIQTAVVRVVEKHLPANIDTLWFGLYGDAGYYLGGIANYVSGTDFQLDWLPAQRYISCPVLDAIAAVDKTSEAASTVYSYALTFGAAALISRFATQGLRYRVVVGFDSGDLAVVTNARPRRLKR